MKKEAAETSLEQRLKSVRNLCGRRIHVFDAISELEDVQEIRKAVPYADKSSTMRADVGEAFSLSMHSLIKAAKACFSQPVANLDSVKDELITTHYDEDPFLNLLNAKKFDGIYETADERVRRDQYREIKESYFDDREAVIINVYNQMLAHEKNIAAKPRRFKLLYGLTIANTLLLASLAVYAVVGTIQGISMFKKETQSIKQEIEMKEKSYIFQFYEFADRIDPPKDAKDKDAKHNLPLAERVDQVIQVYENRIIAKGETRYQTISNEGRQQMKTDIITMIKEGKFDDAIEGYLKRKMQGK